MDYGQTAEPVPPGLQFSTAGAHTVSVLADPDNDLIVGIETDNAAGGGAGRAGRCLSNLTIASFNAAR